MRELVTAIPDVEALLLLEPEELGAKMLFLLRKRNQAQYHRGNIQSEIFADGNQPGYPRNREADVSLAVSEAWSWLEAQGLLVEADWTNGANGWRVLSRRARRMESGGIHRFSSRPLATQGDSQSAVLRRSLDRVRSREL